MAKAKKVLKVVDLKTKPKFIIGLDLSLTATGWSRFNTETKELSYGTIKTPLKGMARLDYIVTEIANNTPEGSEAYIENYGFSSKGQVVYQGELGGIVRHSLWKRGIRYSDVPPTKSKKFLTGSGVCEKSLILKELYKKYKIDVNDDNEADAVVLNLIGQAQHELIPITFAQKDTIKDIKKAD